jgi:hypothetical protein
MSTIDKTMPLGRPTFILCLDTYSRTPLGYAITFEPPSLRTALLALQSVTQTSVLTEDAALKADACPPSR